LSPQEIRNNVCQIETKHYPENIKQTLLGFKPHALILRDIQNSDGQKVLQLRIVDVDTWTGLIKFHQLLDKTLL